MKNGQKSPNTFAKVFSIILNKRLSINMLFSAGIYILLYGCSYIEPSELSADLEGEFAHVHCDGNNWFEMHLNEVKIKEVTSYCSIFRHCVIVHERSHIEDLRDEFPNSCNGKSHGTLPDLLEVDYTWFLASECKAYNKELICLNQNRQACSQRIEDLRTSLIPYTCR